MSAPRVIGVLTCDQLLIAEGLGYQAIPMNLEVIHGKLSVPFLMTLADIWKVGQLWIHPSVTERFGFPSTAPELGAQWAIRPALPAQKPWYHGYIPGTTGEGVDLSFPGIDDRAAWRHCPTGESLLEQVQAFNSAMRYQYAWSPGSTGIALMREVHRHGDRRIELIADAPAVATMHPEPAQDFAWIRGLTAEDEGYTYLHGFDKNAMYLGASGSLELPLGEWEYDAEPWAINYPMTRILPGYFRLNTYAHRGDIPLLAPNITDPDGFRMARPSSPLWITTPTLEAMLQAGYDVEVGEAYTWRQHARMLSGWQARLREARIALQSPETPQALQTFKGTYTQALGLLGHRSDTGKRSALYRPEWRHLVMAQAAANLWRQAVTAVKNGVPVVAVVTDCLYVLSSEADPGTVAAQAGLKLGAGIGEYKTVNAAIPLTEVRELFAPERVRGYGSKRLALRNLSMYLGRRAREYAIQSVGNTPAGA